jgi:hypothetical protein
MELKGSLPGLQELTAGLSPEPDESSEYHTILFLSDPPLIYLYDIST